MKIFKRVAAFVLILALILTSSDFTQIVNAAMEVDCLKVENQFVSYVVDKKTGRFGINTVEGAPRRTNDQQAPLLFKGEQPDTSFTTFRIDDKDYVFGNDYGFLGIQGGMTKSPTTQGGINTSVWMLGDVEVRQQLTLVSDSSHPDVGNVKVTYTVVNNGKTRKSIGSRILFDTMLGTNDGSPLIISGFEKPVEYEISLEGEEVPSFWQSADTGISPEIVSYGLVSGWGNAAPDRMIAAHWSGIGSTKWDYQVDSTVKFTSVFNKYNVSDSAIALYWNPQTFEPGETRVYETFYGLGVFTTADGKTFLATMTGPDRLDINEDKTGYLQEEFEISLELDNSLPVSVPMKDLKATIELEGGLKLASGQSKEKSLGILEQDSRATLTWNVQGELTEFFRIANATIFLKSESLTETLRYEKYIILPGSTGKLPDIQYTDITPKNLYYKDTRKSFNINGTGFELLNDRSRWDLKLVKGGSNSSVYTINHKMINVIGDKQIQVLLPDLNDIGVYSVKLSHKNFPGCTFEDALNVSADTAYKNLKYGILTIVSDGISTYKVNAFETEEQLERLNDMEKDKILLVVRGDIQKKADGKYEVYSSSDTPVEMNGILLYKSDVPITISESKGSVSLVGNGGLSVSGSVTFWKWGFEICFDKGTKYSLTPSDEDDNEDNNKRVEIVFTGAGGIIKNMLAGFNLNFTNAYFYKDDQGYSLIFGGSLYLSLGKKKDQEDANTNANQNKKDEIQDKKDESQDKKDESQSKKDESQSKKDESKNKKDDEDDEDDEDDPFKIEVEVDKVAIGQKSNNKIGLKGIAAEATVGFPKGYFPPPMDIGAEASMKIDTFSDPGEFGMSLDVDLKIIKVKGEVEFVLIPYPIPDKLCFYLGSEVLGVDIIPPIPVATIMGVGGGIDNIYNFVDASSPPVTVMLTVTAELGKILKMKDVTLSISWQHAELKGDIKIKKYDIIKDATVRIRWYTPFGFHASARIEAFDCIEGKVLINIFKDDIMGIGSVRLYIPEKVPVVGNMTIAGAELGIDIEKLWGQLQIIGVTLGVKYVFGTHEPNFYIGEEEYNQYLDGSKALCALDYEDYVAYQNGTKGLCALDLKDEKTGEEGRMIFGTNVRLVGSSKSDKAYAMDKKYLAVASEDKRFMLMGMPYVVALNDNTYQLNVESPEAALFEIEYEGAKPNVRVIKPDGTEYVLVEDDISGNMRYQTIGAKHSESGKDEQKLWISVVNPQLGLWKIISDKPLETAKLYDIKMAPEFTSLSSTKIDNSMVKVDWTGEYMSGANINLFLLEEGSNESGRLLESDIDATKGSYTLVLPDDVPTGRYVIRAELKKADYGFTSRNTNAFDVLDIKAPDKPRNLKVVSAGNGCLKVNWDQESASRYPAQGYIITVLNEDGTVVSGFPEAYVSEGNETIIGGEVTQQDGTTIRLEPGRSYKVSIMAHREDELVEGEAIKRQHYSEPVISNAVFLPVPQPPKLKLMLRQGGEILPLNTTENNIDEYYSKEKEVMLTLEADNPASASIYLNDEAVYSGITAGQHQFMLNLNEGENKVAIRATNSAGDFTDKVIRIISDTVPPLLLIDSTEIKQSKGTTIAVLKGKCEPGSKLTINGGDATPDSNGMFEYSLIIGDSMSIEIYVAAEDSVGNITEYKNTVYNNTLKAIQKVRITPDSPTLEVGESLRLGLNAVDSEGNQLSVKPELVKWSLMADTGTVTLDNDANVKALKTGKAYVMAEYKVTDGYAHTDAIPLTIVESTGKKPKAAIKKLTGPADVLSSIAAVEKGRMDIYLGRLQPGKKTVLEIDDSLTLDIPAGSLDNTADIKVSRFDNQEELMKKFPGMRLLSPMFDISLNKDIKLTAPIFVNFNYETENVTDIRRVAVYRLDEQRGRWDYIGGSIDRVNGIITVMLSNFSKYAVIENSNIKLLKDVEENSWSRDSIYSLVHQGIVDGVEIDGAYYFKLDTYITRAEFIKILSAGLGMDLKVDDVILPFADNMAIPDWALKHVKTAFMNGWLNGKVIEGKKLVDSKGQITREEACAILGRMVGDSVRPKGIYFSDRDKVANYAASYIDVLADMKIIKGYDDDTFKPKNHITREEAAAIVDRYIKSR